MRTFFRLCGAVWLFAVLLVVAGEAGAVPLQTWSDWVTNYPSAARAVTPAALMVRGMNENAYYVLEVDPTTGEIPVTANVSINAEGTPGSAVPSVALYVGGTDGTDLRGLKTDSSGELQVDVLSSALPTGAATAANQTTANTSLSSIDGKLPALVSGRVPVDGSGVTQPVSGTVTADAGSGTFAVSAASLPLPTGAATAAKQPALGTAGTASSDVITVQGIASMTALKVDGSAVTQPVSDGGGSLTVDGTVASSNWPATVDTNSGAAGSSTPRVVLATRHEAAATPISVRLSNGSAFGTPSPAGRSYADSARNDYSSSNVTTGAWVQLIASTAATINAVSLFDSCGQTLELGTGAAASEARVAIIPPGGFDGLIPLTIASGTRVSVRAISGTCSSGELDLTGFN